jgi:hypothetical protein
MLILFFEKSKFMNKLLLFLLTSLFITQIIAQNCGTPENENWLEEWEQRGGRRYLKQGYIRPRNTIFIPIHYHIVRQLNGSGGFPLTYLFKMHCELNQRYANTGIQFTLDTFSYINSDTYFNLDQAANGSDAESQAMSLAFNTLNHCNIYLVNQPLPGNCGYTYRPTGGNPTRRSSIYLAASYGNYTCTQPTSTTLTHEMGHWLDLPHTFWGWEGKTYVSRTSPNITFPRRENVARTGTQANCETAGDMFCDTDPDYVSQRWSCPNTKQFIDPNNVTFTLKSDNYMSYSSDDCQSKFSENQIAHMNDAMITLNDRKDLLLLPQPIIAPMSTDTFFEPKTHTMRTSRKNLFIRFRKVLNATSYHIVIAKGTTVLNNSFNITPASVKIDTIITDTSLLVPESIFTANDNSYYYWEMTPINKVYTCTSSGISMQNFRVSANSIVFNIKDESCFSLNDGELSLNTNTGNVAEYKLNGTTILPIPFLNLTPGNYFVDVKFSATDIVRSYFQIIAAKEIIPTFTQIGNTITANVTGGKPPYTYIWKNGKPNNKSITGNPGESVDLIVADANNCESGTYTAKFKSSAIQESEKFALFVSPQLLNQNDKLMINSKYIGNMDIQINSIDGKLVYQKSFESNQNTITLDWKSNMIGVFIVNVITKDFQREIKVVVR